MFNNAAAYDGYVGRWSRLVGEQFIAWLNIPFGRKWFDLGAGTGVLTSVILQQAVPESILGMDLSESYIERAHQNVRDERVQFKVADASTAVTDSPQFDVVVSGLVLNFVPSPQETLETMKLLAKPAGTVAAYVWDYAGKMEMMRHFWDAAIVLDPAAADMDSGKRFDICKPDNLRAAFEALNLSAVEVRPFDVQTVFKDFDDYWQPFLAAQGSISKYLTSLDDQAKNALRQQLQKQLPTNNDGSIHLTARAWAAKGIK
ncbi:MAG: methyltransferase domain-containing protein [Anaerolineaceae bacterium]|nr:methyltransferase domain-containing protein [Anaerolineaceae bacterium]